MLLLNLGDELPRDTLPTTSTRRVLGSGYRRGSDVEALGTPVLVVGAFTTLDGTEAHGVEPTLDGGRRGTYQEPCSKRNSAHLEA